MNSSSQLIQILDENIFIDPLMHKDQIRKKLKIVLGAIRKFDGCEYQINQLRLAIMVFLDELSEEGDSFWTCKTLKNKKLWKKINSQANVLVDFLSIL